MDLLWSTTYINMYTRKQKYCDTVEFFPHQTKMKFMPSSDRAFLATVDLTEELIHKNTEAPFAKNWGNTVGTPKTIGNPVSIPHEQTLYTPKGGIDSKESRTTKCEHSCTTKGGENNQFTISKGEYTKKPEPTIPSDHTTRYRDR